MAPTTAIAEIALVSDMSGVCKSRETRRITSSPTNVASMKTNKAEMISKDGSAAGVGCGNGEAKAPNFNIQAPVNQQLPNTKATLRARKRFVGFSSGLRMLDFRAWSLELLWSLDVGAWMFIFPSAFDSKFPHHGSTRLLV